MDQNPMTQGGNTPTQGGQPANTNTNPNLDASQNPNVTFGGDQNMVVMGATIETTSPTGQVTSTELVPKPKKHTGIIALIVSLVVILLAGGGFAFWYFGLRSNPEKIAYDAITGFLKEKNLQIDGDFHAPIIENGKTVANVSIEIDSSTDHVTGESKVKFSLVPTEYGLTSTPELAAHPDFDGFAIEVGSAFMSDGVIYFRLDNLMDTIDTYLDIMEIDIAETDGFAPMAYHLAETIDGEWWQISVPDIIDWLSELSGNTEIDSLSDFYACMVKTIQTDMSNDLVNIYDQNRFVQIEKVATLDDIKDAPSMSPSAGHSFYTLDIDYDKLAAFTNALPTSPVAESGYQCINTLIDAQGGSSSDHVGASDFDEVTAEELREDAQDEFGFILEISDRDHTLRSIIYYGKDDYVGQTGTLVFSHSSVTVNAPANYRPVTDLLEEIMQYIFADIFGGLGSEFGSELYYDEETGEWVSAGPIYSGSIGGLYYNGADEKDELSDDEWMEWLDSLNDV